MQLVMFDIDGTLVDSNAFDSDLYAQAIQTELGVQVDKIWASYRNVTDSGILEELLEQHASDGDWVKLGSRVKSKFIDLIHEYVTSKHHLVEAIPGACKLLDRFKQLPDVTVAIATGGWRETAELKLKAVGIDYEDLAFATASEARSRIEIMQLAERQAASHAVFSRKTYFGDATWDQQASKKLGYNFVAVGSQVEHTIKFEDLSDHEAIFELLGL